MIKFKYCPKCGGELVTKRVRTHDRLVCSSCEFIFFQNPKPTVGVFIIEKGKVLLARRALAPFKGYWDSVGGFIEDGESPQETAIRETKEETGLDIKILEILGTGKDTYGDQDIVPIAILAEITSGDPSPKDDVSELKWFPLEELPSDLAFEGNKKALNLIKRKLYNKKQV